MLNSYSYSQGGHANASNYLKINAISGTLVKNHPLSIFVKAKLDSTIFDPTNPRCIFPKAESYQESVLRRTEKYNKETCEFETKYEKVMETRTKDVEVPCVVLQSMIIADGLFLCEIVKTEDFFAVENQNSNKEE